MTLNGPRQSGLRAVDLLEGVTRTAGCAASGASLSVLLLAVRANQAEEFI